MKTLGDRVREARERIGMSQAELAERSGISQQSVAAVETNAVRRPRHLVEIARALGVAAQFLIDGASPAGTPQARMIAVVGYVGAGAEVRPHDDFARGQGLDEVPPPPGFNGSCVALKVRGDSLYPLLDDGWIIYYQRDIIGVSDDAVNRLCVAETSDGRVLVKRLRRGAGKSTWTLESLNAPPIENVRLRWAAPVLAMSAP